MSVAYSLNGIRYAVSGQTILNGVDLQVHYGQVLALVGPNGAGKSTLLGVLGGEIVADAGTVTLDGQPLADWDLRALARARAVLPQTNRVAFSFTVAQVVEMGRSPWIGHSDAAEDQRRIDNAVARTDVGHLLHRPFPALSGGEAARASLARVLTQDTPVVLLDEPTAALDLRHQEAVLQLARELAAAGRAVVVVLHDLSLAAAYADAVVMLDQGAVVRAGAPADVFTETLIAEVYQLDVRVMADPDTGLPVILPRRQR